MTINFRWLLQRWCPRCRSFLPHKTFPAKHPFNKPITVSSRLDNPPVSCLQPKSTAKIGNLSKHYKCLIRAKPFNTKISISPHSSENAGTIDTYTTGGYVLPTLGWGKQSIWLAASGRQTPFAGRSPHPLARPIGPNDRRKTMIPELAPSRKTITRAKRKASR